MVSKLVSCYHCGSIEIKRNGFVPNGKQKYQCKDCGKASREDPDPGYSEGRKEEILKAYQERSSLWGVARTLGVSRTTVSKWLKKSQGVTTSYSCLAKIHLLRKYAWTRFKNALPHQSRNVLKGNRCGLQYLSRARDLKNMRLQASFA